MPEQQPDSPPEPGITLDELAAAYAQSVGGRVESAAEPGQHVPEGLPAQPSPDESAEASEDEAGPGPTAGPPVPEEEGRGEDDPCPLSPRTIFEAMLFVGDQENEPLTAAKAAELMRGVSVEEIPGLVDELNRRYASNGCPYRIVSEGAGYRITLRKRFHSVRNKFYGRVREARLSQAALDVLAIVAYRQPVTAEDVNRLRDTPSGHVLAQLVRRQLLRIERPLEKPKRVTYHTTDRFLELFGLESLDELPLAEDIEKR